MSRYAASCITQIVIDKKKFHNSKSSDKHGTSSTYIQSTIYNIATYNRISIHSISWFYWYFSFKIHVWNKNCLLLLTSHKFRACTNHNLQPHLIIFPTGGGQIGGRGCVVESQSCGVGRAVVQVIKGERWSTRGG